MTSVTVTSSPYTVTVDSAGTSVTVAAVAASATSGTVTSITPASDGGSGTAITGAGTITIAGGTLLTSTTSGTTLTINHDAAGSTGTGKAYPSSITVDAYGHVTGSGSTVTPLVAANNLSDVTASTARGNLGLGTAAVLAVGISNTNVLQANAVVADDDFLRIDGTTVEGRSAAETLSDIGAAAASHNQSAATITSGTLAVARGGTGVTSLPMVTIPGAADAAAARVVLGVTNVGSYTGQIETAADKTYTLDPGVATDRTITGFYIKTASGTVVVHLKVGTDVVKTLTATASTNNQTSLANTGVSANDVLTLVTSSNSSALDVIFAVEYTE